MYEPNIPVEASGDYSDVIYMVGYALSLIALTIALIIFLKFRYGLNYSMIFEYLKNIVL